MITFDLLNGSQVETSPGGLLVRPISVFGGKPWVRVERTATDDVVGADKICESLGASFQLIGNQHWQAIARDIELVTSNFDTSGLPKDHAFNRGHSEGSAALAASANDAEGCANYQYLECFYLGNIKNRSKVLLRMIQSYKLNCFSKLQLYTPTMKGIVFC